MKIDRQSETQQEFLARGRESLATAKESGEFHPLHEVLDRMRARLATRMDEVKRAPRTKTGKP